MHDKTVLVTIKLQICFKKYILVNLKIKLLVGLHYTVQQRLGVKN